jgi:hypothetical protein
MGALEAPQFAIQNFRLSALAGERGRMSIHEFVSIRLIDVLEIVIGLACLYLAWLQVTGGGAARH